MKICLLLDIVKIRHLFLLTLILFTFDISMKIICIYILSNSLPLLRLKPVVYRSPSKYHQFRFCHSQKILISQARATHRMYKWLSVTLTFASAPIWCSSRCIRYSNRPFQFCQFCSENVTAALYYKRSLDH